jgi:hypothetical protein
LATRSEREPKNLQELLTKLETPIVIRPTRRMTQGELETYLDKAADILRGNADHSEFRGYAGAVLGQEAAEPLAVADHRSGQPAIQRAEGPRPHPRLLRHLRSPERGAELPP